MAPSRSSSEPRERTTRSRGYDRQLRRRSKSPINRHAGSRKSRSRSRSSSSEKRVHKKQKKHSKKRHMKHKKEKEQKQKAEDNTLPSIPILSVEVGEGAGKELEELPLETTPVDAKSFFEQLQKQEAAKRPVGTVHSRNLPAPVSATMISTSDKWECSKAGCGHMNFKHAPACNKCKAMKRLTEWR